MIEKFTEKTLIEDYISEKLKEKGWNEIPSEQLEREGYDEFLLIPVLSKIIKKLNTDIEEKEIIKVINELKLSGTGQEGAKRILQFYKFGVPVILEKERILRYIKLFDYENISNNEFTFSRQVYFSGIEKIRVDLVLYVNGIPLVNIECKNPLNPTETWFDAYKQIKEYQKKVPELYKYIQIGICAESVAKYFPIVQWQELVKVEEWKEDNLDSIDSCIEMISPSKLLDIIKNFIFYRIERGNATKVITRYMQYRAVNKIYERVLNYINGKDDKNKGLIWHWQGSGKTLTMIFGCNKLYYEKELENPSIFFIVDRVELQEQLYTEFTSLDIVKPEIIENVQNLKEIISYDNYRGKRGVFITLIHKFRYDEMVSLLKEIENMKEPNIMTRKNIVAFVDEGHRTQYGTLAKMMRSILKNSFFFAFTGTPISKKGRDTFWEFSYPDEELYLDRYFINDSINDGFTVKIVYKPRVDNVINLKKELLDVFLESEFEELPEEIREDLEDRLKQNLNVIKTHFENPERIKKVAEDIVNHFKENIDGKFKAMVVAGSRKACELYHQEFEKLIPGYSEVVITYDNDDEPILVESARDKRERYDGKDLDTIRKEVIEKFKDEEYPKILIVTDMLLTGFDAPILQTIYLDKLLKEHRLLQAVARTNRPYKNLKEFGLVVDYVGILSEMKKALQFYNEEDVKTTISEYESLKNEFYDIIDNLINILNVEKIEFSREKLIEKIELLTTDEEIKKEFVEGYRKARKLYESLGGIQLESEYLEKYKYLSAVYLFYMKMIKDSLPFEVEYERFYQKTLENIYKSSEVIKLDIELPETVIDTSYLDMLNKRITDKREKAMSILFTLNKLVLVEKTRNPIYESLVEKVERLFEQWREKVKNYEKIYEDAVNVFKEICELEDKRKQLNLSNVEYSIYIILNEKTGEDALKLSSQVYSNIKNLIFPNWTNQKTARKNVEREIRSFVRKLKVKYNFSKEDMDNIHNKLVNSIIMYG